MRYKTHPGRITTFLDNADTIGRIWKNTDDTFAHAEIVYRRISNIRELNGMKEFLGYVAIKMNHQSVDEKTEQDGTPKPHSQYMVCDGRYPATYRPNKNIELPLAMSVDDFLCVAKRMFSTIRCDAETNEYERIEADTIVDHICLIEKIRRDNRV